MGGIARPSAFVLLALAGCFPIEAFECRDNDGCVLDGVKGECEAEGVCSYPDERCESRRRYSENAGALAGQCVEDPPGTSEGCSEVLIAERGFELCDAESTWAQARDACALRSMTLASIHAEMESDALGALVPSPRVAWIGLSDRDIEGDYAWVDLSPADFTAWGPNEPDDADGEEDCVALSHEGMWSAWRCETPQPYVCADP